MRHCISMLQTQLLPTRLISLIVLNCTRYYPETFFLSRDSGSRKVKNIPTTAVFAIAFFV